MAKPAARMVLEKHLELFMIHHSNIYRAASYDGGVSWLSPWDQMSQPTPFNHIGSPAVCGSSFGDVHRFLVTADTPAGQTPTGSYFLNSADLYWFRWQPDWLRVGAGFRSNPACACSGDSSILFMVGRQSNDTIQSIRLQSAVWETVTLPGTKWREDPAVAASHDGRRVLIASLDNTGAYQCMVSTDSGRIFAPLELPPGPRFDSSPALAMNALGDIAYLVGRTTDTNYFVLPIAGLEVGSWSQITGGLFLSAPAAATNTPGNHLVVAGMGTDHYVWRAVSTNAGTSWQHDWEQVPKRSFE